MHIINAEEQHIPAIRRIYAHHVLHGTGSFETAPGHAGNACPGEKRSVTWISLVYRPAGGRSSATVISPATANAMPTGLRLKIRCTSIRLISGRGAEKPYSIMP